MGEEQSETSTVPFYSLLQYPDPTAMAARSGNHTIMGKPVEYHDQMCPIQSNRMNIMHRAYVTPAKLKD